MEEREIDLIELAVIMGAKKTWNWDKETTVNGTCSIDWYMDRKVTFINSGQYARYLGGLRGAVVVISEDLEAYCRKYPQNTYLVVDDVLSAMRTLQRHFYGDGELGETEIRPTAVVDGSARIGNGVYVGEHAHIGKDAVVGDGTRIMESVVVYEGCEIGDGCVIHAGVVIGCDGVRYEDVGKRSVEGLVHAGSVKIGNRVQIGGNSVIVRSVFEGKPTVISDDVRIGNLVNIGHNARIGSGSVLCGHNCICGSVVIEEDCFVGVGVVITAGKVIGRKASVLINAVVVSDVKEGETVGGFYAMSHNEWKRIWNELRENRNN